MEVRRGWSSKPGNITQFLKKFEYVQKKLQSADLTEDEKQAYIAKSKSYWSAFLMMAKGKKPKKKRTPKLTS